MNKVEYEALVETLDPNDRAILNETKRLGDATVAMLRPVTKSPSTGEPLAYGLTRELRRLQERGLLRRVERGHPARYAAVAVEKVEAAAHSYEIHKRKRTRKR